MFPNLLMKDVESSLVVLEVVDFGPKGNVVQERGVSLLIHESSMMIRLGFQLVLVFALRFLVV